MLPILQNPAMLKLAEARQRCNVCMKSTPGLIQNGSTRSHDPLIQSHWAQWLGDPKPAIVIVGQDFGTLDYFDAFKGKDDPRNETNMQLYQLMRHAGLKPGRPVDHDGQSGVFLTNSVLCFKTASHMNAPVKKLWTTACTTIHLLPLLDELKPRVVVAMGGPSWEAVRKVFKLKAAPGKILKAAGQSWRAGPFDIFAMAHCSRLGQRNRKPEFQVDDWKKLGLFLRNAGQQQTGQDQQP